MLIARARQLLRKINQIDEQLDLKSLDEAELLWQAESNGKQGGRIANDWGCVALLVNPGREIPGEINAGWKERVAAAVQYGSVRCTKSEGPIVTRDGLLMLAEGFPARTTCSARSPMSTQPGI